MFYISLAPNASESDVANYTFKSLNTLETKDFLEFCNGKHCIKTSHFHQNMKNTQSLFKTF